MFKKLSSLASATCVAFALVASWLVSLRPVSAADIIVNPGESIQAAIDSASPGDTIIIQPGIYTETLTLNKPVSLTGVSSDTVILVLPPNTPAEIPLLTIDGNSISSEVLVAGLTLKGQNLTGQKGIFILNSAQPSLENLTITFFEWGVYIDNSSPTTFKNITIAENHLLGIWTESSITITGGEFRQNYFTVNGTGSAVAVITNSHFISNYMALWFENNIYLENSTLTEGDVAIQSNSQIYITQTTLSNYSYKTIQAHSAYLYQSLITNNQSCRRPWEIGIAVIYITETLTVQDSFITNNDARSECEGVIIIKANNTIVQNSTIANNALSSFTPHSAALLYIFGTLIIDSSTISNNVGWIQSFGDMVVNQSYIANNNINQPPTNIIFSASSLTVTASSLINNNGMWGAEQNAYIANSQIISGLSSLIGQDLTVINSTLSGHTQLHPPSPDPEYPDGYGVFQVGGSAYISNSHITNNHSTLCNGSSALYLFPFGHATILDSTFAHNTAHCANSNNYVPGAAVAAGSATIKNSQFINNQATGFADGSAVVGFDMSITDSYFAENNVERPGFAIYGAILSITNSTFISHTGPGVLIDSSYLTINQTEFINNQTNYAVIMGSWPDIEEPGYLHLNQSRFVGNHAPAVVSSDYVTITNSLFAHNTPAAPEQPIIEIIEGHLTLHHNTFANESLLANPAVVAYTSSVTVANNIINLFEVGLVGYNSTLWEDYNLLNNSTNISWDSPIVPGSHTLLNLDPSFVNPAAGNFSLLPNSPAVDKGLDLGYLLDLDNNLRLQSVAPDLGALESPYTGQPLGVFRLTPAALSVDENSLTAVVTITLDQPLTFSTQVSYETSDNTATAGQDYSSAAGTLTFLPSTTSQTVTVALLDDALFEGSETFALALHSPVSGVLGSPFTTTITILDNDPAPPEPITPTVQFAQASYNMGESAGQLLVQVTLDQPVSQTVTVGYLSQNGSATAGQDYSSAAGTLTFLPGTTSQTVSLTLLDDILFEGSETFVLALHTPISGVLGSPFTTTITILDNDPAPPEPITPTVQFAQASYTTTEEVGSLLFTLSLSETVAHTVTVQIHTITGSALPGSDYFPFTHTIVFAPGQLTQTISLTLVNDALPEPTEWLTITLSNPAGGTLGSISEAVVYILDADIPPPVFHQLYLPVLLRP